MKRVGAPLAWTSPSDLDKTRSNGRDPPQGVEPHAHRGVVGATVTRGTVSEKDSELYGALHIYYVMILMPFIYHQDSGARGRYESRDH